MSCKLVPDKLTVELLSSLGWAVTGGGREVVFVAGQKGLGGAEICGWWVPRQNLDPGLEQKSA